MGGRRAGVEASTGGSGRFSTFDTLGIAGDFHAVCTELSFQVFQTFNITRFTIVHIKIVGHVHYHSESQDSSNTLPVAGIVNVNLSLDVADAVADSLLIHDGHPSSFFPDLADGETGLVTGLAGWNNGALGHINLIWHFHFALPAHGLDNIGWGDHVAISWLHRFSW